MEEIAVSKQGSVLEYELNSDGNKYIFGRIYATRLLQDIVICIYRHEDGNWHQGAYSMVDAKMIVSNTDNYYSALQRISSVFGLQT